MRTPTPRPEPMSVCKYTYLDGTVLQAGASVVRTEVNLIYDIPGAKLNSSEVGNGLRGITPIDRVTEAQLAKVVTTPVSGKTANRRTVFVAVEAVRRR